MLSKEPVRIRRDWDSAVIAECDFCSHSGWTVAHSDSREKICASCCDIEFLSNWQDYAKSLATEVLSLREQLAEKEERLCRLRTSLEIEMKGHEAAERQLAELKGGQVPVAVVELSDYLTVDEMLGDIPRRKAVRELYEGALVIGQELFTAAKPAEIPRHIYSMLVNELRDVPAIGCKRELIIGVLNRHGVTAEPVQFDPPATE
ncbi:TPA: hypothetical protein ACPZQD_001016 [Yersinia enterocolitica]